MAHVYHAFICADFICSAWAYGQKHMVFCMFCFFLCLYVQVDSSQRFRAFIGFLTMYSYICFYWSFLTSVLLKYWFHSNVEMTRLFNIKSFSLNWVGQDLTNCSCCIFIQEIGSIICFLFVSLGNIFCPLKHQVSAFAALCQQTCCLWYFHNVVKMWCENSPTDQWLRQSNMGKWALIAQGNPTRKALYSHVTLFHITQKQCSNQACGTWFISISMGRSLWNSC